MIEGPCAEDERTDWATFEAVAWPHTGTARGTDMKRYIAAVLQGAVGGEGAGDTAAASWL